MLTFANYPREEEGVPLLLQVFGHKLKYWTYCHVYLLKVCKVRGSDGDTCSLLTWLEFLQGMFV